MSSVSPRAGAESYDFIILGAGQAGMVLARFLGGLAGRRVLLLDPRPGRYKIGESIVPEHFQHPELEALLPAIRELPSYQPKRGVAFVDASSVAVFPLPEDGPDRSLHVARSELEELMIEAWDLDVRRERVRSVDVRSRTVQTDEGSYTSEGPLCDCTGPAMVIARTLNEIRSLEPAYASWAYLDVLGVDAEAWLAHHVEQGRSLVHYDARRRRLLQAERFTHLDPGLHTILARAGERAWCWQIPLFGGRRLSFGLVRSDRPVEPEELMEAAEVHAGPGRRLERRSLTGQTPYDRIHRRNGFARRAVHAATEDYILVGDAFAFADPIYSVGTALAVNKAIEVALWLSERPWDAAAARGYSARMEGLMERALAAFRFWHSGEVLRSDAAAAEVRDGFLVGSAFQTGAALHYGASLDAVALTRGEHQDRTEAIDWSRGSARGHLEGALGMEPGQPLAGWTLGETHFSTRGIVATWTPGEGPALLMVLVPAAAAPTAYRKIGGLHLYYTSTFEGSYPFSEGVRELFDEVEERLRPQGVGLLCPDAGRPAAAVAAP